MTVLLYGYIIISLLNASANGDGDSGGGGVDGSWPSQPLDIAVTPD